jgi:hypothetical protein
MYQEAEKLFLYIIGGQINETLSTL